MSLSSWLFWTFSRSHARRGKRRKSGSRPKTARLFLEQLESRVTPSFGLSTVALFNGANGAASGAGLIMDGSGNLYGTATNGGANGDGTVFERAKGSDTITTLASFNGTNGSGPNDVSMDSSGNLYGTTATGGVNDNGTVFELAHGSGTITTLASFNGTNSAFPNGGLVMDSSGNLYGTTSWVGAPNYGATVFELAHGSGTITTLATFNGTNGQRPLAGLIMDSSGNLYGTANLGGASSTDYMTADGTVFELAHGSSTITALASFNGTDGANPYGALIMDKSGNLYGTASAGGRSGDGTVFELAHGSRTITKLASFNGTNGAGPDAALIMDRSGNLYGTAPGGGASSDGTVFELAKGSSSLTNLVSFNGTDGAIPECNLIMDSSGNLYGTAYEGGAANEGTVFELSPHAPALSWTPAPIIAGMPLSSTQLNASAADSVTGAAVAGTFVYTPPAGTILPLGWQTLSVTFTPTDTTHYSPITTIAPVLVSQVTPLITWKTPAPISPSTLLSTTQLDASAADPNTGAAVAGTFVYTSPAGTILPLGSQRLSVTFTPTDTTEYTIVTAGVTLVVKPLTPVITWNTPAPITPGTPLSSVQLDATAADPNTESPVSGTFVYTPPAGTILLRGSTTLTVTFTPTDTTDYITAQASVALVVPPSYSVFDLASFNSSNGADPEAGLIVDSSGNFYGTTDLGGPNGYGTVFELAKGSSSLTTLASLNSTNGAYPEAGLILDSSGNLYGTTANGGANGDGTVFELAKGSGAITTLASFNGSNGVEPEAGLIMDSSGNLYGTTSGGFSIFHGPGIGTVFELAKGSSTITTLASFDGSDGLYPLAGLVMDGSGNLYGTTEYGGPAYNPSRNQLGDGTVFELAKGSSGTFTFTTRASFNGADGETPAGALIMDPNGNLYGTTEYGGIGYAATSVRQSGDGTVFELAKGSSTITPVAFFNGPNGEAPRAGLIMDRSGNLYGTTYDGGASGYGTVFEVGAGSGIVTTMISFGGSYGEYPLAGLIMDSSGNFYGTTQSGGASKDGTVFELPAAVPPSVQISAFPSSTSAGTAQTFTVTVQTDGSTDTGYTGTVHFTCTDARAMLPANYTFTAANAGVATFTATLTTAGTRSITATDTVNSFVTGSATTTVSAAAASSLTIGGFPSPTTAGTAANVAVTALDAYGNIATTYTGTVHLTSSDRKAVLPANYTFTPADAGTYVFSATLETAGTQSITATDTVTSGMTSTQTGIAVNPAAAGMLVITGPATATADVAFGITVTAYDAYGNVATGYTGTVKFKCTDSTATLPAKYTFKASNAGKHTFRGLVLKKKGTPSITATDTHTLSSAITGSLDVVAAAPAWARWS